MSDIAKVVVVILEEFGFKPRIVQPKVPFGLADSDETFVRIYAYTHDRTDAHVFRVVNSVGHSNCDVNNVFLVDFNDPTSIDGLREFLSRHFGPSHVFVNDIDIHYRHFFLR